MTLYELEEEFATLLDLMENPVLTADKRAELEERLAEAGEGIEAKYPGYMRVLRQLDADEAMVDAEIKRLQAQKKVIGKNRDDLRFKLATCMQLTGRKKFSDGIDTILPTTSVKVVVTDLSALQAAHPELVRRKETFDADKTALKKLLKAGEEIDGAILEETLSLSFKKVTPNPNATADGDEE